MYGEVLLLFNATYNALLVLVCSRLLDEPIQLKRLLLFSVLSSLCLLLPFLAIINSCCAFFILMFAFQQGSWMKKASYLFVMTLVLGGMFTAFQTYATTNLKYYSGMVIITIVGLIACSYFLKKMLLHQLVGHYEVPCELVVDGHHLSATGFVDTGNQAIEPLTGRSIHFASVELLQQYPQLQQAFLRWNSNKAADLSMFPNPLHPQLSAIHVTTVDGNNLVLAMKCALIIQQQKFHQQYVVFVHQTFQFRRPVHIILNASMIQTLKGDRYCYEA